MVKKKLNIDNW